MDNRKRMIGAGVIAAVVVVVLVMLLNEGSERPPDIDASGPLSEIEVLQPDSRVDAEPGEAPDTAAPVGGSADTIPPLQDEGADPPGAPGSGDDPVSSTGGSDAPGTPAAERSPARAAAGGGSGGSGGPVASSAGSAQAPSTEAILRATARRYEGVRSLQADFRQTLVNPLLGTRTRSRGTLFQRQPDRFLMRFSDPAGDVIVSDGRHFWLYFPSVDEKQVIRSTRGAQGLDLRSQFVGDPVERFDATYHGRESVGGRSAHVLTLVPREPLGYESLKVWIDAEDHLVRRFELTEGTGNVRHFELSDVVLNPTLPDRLFEFDPPAGAHVVDRG